MLKELDDKNINELKDDIKNFIFNYYSIVIKLAIKDSIMLINTSTLLFLIKWNVDLDKFQEILDDDPKLNKLVNRFLKDNLLHYAATIKFKEQIDNYQKQLEKADGDIFVQFINDYDETIYLKQIKDYQISGNMGLDSDVSEEQLNEIFKDVKVY